MILVYCGYFGYKRGAIRELNNMISYVFAFLLSRMSFPIFSDALNIFILENRLKDKVAYLISFIIIAYILKILTKLIEKLINLKWNNRAIGLVLGIINGMMIMALIISVFKESLPIELQLNQYSNNISLYQNLDVMQKKYLIQYKED
tara:strand:+ start:705 stop:1145 length:441 start_codon:yes stop_codon:yes gene_type:complete